MSSQELDHESNGVHFFKIILQTTLQQGKLKVPKSFVRRHWKGITNPVTLKLPNLSEKKVFWEKTSDYDVWFSHGWKEFANYLSLGDSQCLMFRYQGNSSFKVIVFSKSGLEIKYPLQETNENFEEVEESDCSLQIIEVPYSLRSKRSKSPSLSSKVCKKIKINPKEPKEVKQEKPKVEAYARYPNLRNNVKLLARSSCDDLMERSKILHEKVKKQFKSDKNFFVCMIHKTYIDRDRLAIPMEFAKAHLHRMEGRNATLFIDQHRTWNVDLKLTENNQPRFNFGGWNKFYADNNLKIGDVCVFILNKCKGTVSFQVVSFSLEMDINTPYFQGYKKLISKNGKIVKGCDL